MSALCVYLFSVCSVDACLRHQVLDCGQSGIGHAAVQNDLSEPESPDVFHDLTRDEITAVRRYLESTINLVKPEDAGLGDANIYTMWLEMPNKTSVLNYLDRGARQPDRMARVMVFRGDKTPPVVEEVVCAPLPDITRCDVDLTVPFAHRPSSDLEYDVWDEHLAPEIHRRFGHILKESYGGSFDYENCEDDCFNYWETPVSNALYNLDNKRKIWFMPMFYRRYYSLYPVDFALLINIDGTDGSKFEIEKVWYSGQLFSDLDGFVASYNASTINKTKISYPEDDDQGFSTLRPRGHLKPTVAQRPPELVEPDGKRYTVTHRHVSYLDMWSFHYHISSLHGPALHDVRFNGERIVYEISVKELLATYAGHNPQTRLTVFVDSNFLSGSRSKALVKGSDCPTTATMLSKTVTSQGREEPVTFANAACVFEQNFGRPLRRHHSYSIDEGAFYGGMLDSALVVRSVHTVDNYDYIIEFRFHQDGSLGVSMTSSGYIFANFYADASRPYGVKLTDLMTGPIHMHAAHFKVDMDIHGESNRYETLDLSEEEVEIRQSSPSSRLSQVRMTQTVKRTEKSAALSYNFDTPKYHIFHNDAVRNNRGEKKAYRLVNKAMVKMLVQEDVGSEPGFSWARYQLAVTKRKESERDSSRPYAQWGSDTSYVKFEDWIADDDNIVDEDLVAWVSVGLHHIPHSEDLPVVSTIGTEASFYLHPYNYFPESPSMASRDSVYMEHIDVDHPERGISFMYPGDGRDGGSQASCVYRPTNMTQNFVDDPDSIFETTYNNGVK